MPFRTTYSICIRCEVLTRRSDHRCRKPGAENRKDLQRIANRHNAYRSMMSLVRDQDLFAFVRRKRNQKKLRKCCQNTAKLAVLLVGTHVVSGSRSRTDLLEPKCPAYTDKDNAVLQYLVESDSEETDAGSSRIDSSSSSSSSDDDDDDDDSSTDLSDEEFPADRRSEDDTDSIASSSLNQTPDHWAGAERRAARFAFALQRNAVAADAQQRAENEHASSSEDELRNEIETKLRRESQAMQEEFRRTIAIALNRLRSSLLSIRQQQQFLYGEANALRRDAENFFSETQKKIVGNVNLVIEELQQQQRNGREMSLRRKKLINIDDDDDKDPVELPGNVRVFCRICPVISTDVDTAVVIIDDDSEDESTLLVTTNNGRRRLQFSMDRVFGQRSTQEEIFHDVQPLISSVIDGHNVGILSYGQKGSGKTFTMMGNNSNSNWGISQRAIQFLFNVTNGRKPEWSYTISVSMLEIDDEKIRDLLSDAASHNLEITMSADDGVRWHVPDRIWRKVSTADKAIELINNNIGERIRAITVTNLIKHCCSRRSHAIVSIAVGGFNRMTKMHTTGRLNLIDLAGSGSGSSAGNRFKETPCVNQSLLALENVIYALWNKQTDVRLKKSALAALLHDLFSAELSKMLMLVHVVPNACHLNETLYNLNFAQRVRSAGGTQNSGGYSDDVVDSVEAAAAEAESMEIDSVAFTAASDLASPSCGPGRCRRSSVEHDSDDELDDILSLCSQREPMPVQSNRSQPPTNGCQLSPRTIARYSGQQSWPNLRTCYRFKRGWTVVVTCDLPAGLVICDYAGITMTKFDWEKKCDELYRKAVETDAMVDIERYNNFKDYSAEVANGQCIDAGKSVNGWGRLLNHSKSCPNLTVRINGGRALFRAKRKLAAGCELFWDYGSEYDYSLGDFRCDCFCPAVDCKTNIRYKFGEKIAKEFRRLSALKAVGLKSDFQIADYFAPFDLAEVEAIAAAAALYVPSAAGLPASN